MKMRHCEVQEKLPFQKQLVSYTRYKPVHVTGNHSEFQPATEGTSASYFSNSSPSADDYWLPVSNKGTKPSITLSQKTKFNTSNPINSSPSLPRDVLLLVGTLQPGKEASTHDSCPRHSRVSLTMIGTLPRWNLSLRLVVELGDVKFMVRPWSDAHPLDL